MEQSLARYIHRFTVFTPTYNRAHTLNRVYTSLAAQTFRDFEWLIVDDGSSDNTNQMVEGWKLKADFPIRYMWQPNQGKHVAFNRGVGEARGELFLTLDSDDACVPEALERFDYHWRSIPAEIRSEFSAVTALCIDRNGNLVGREFSRNIVDSDSLEMRYRYRMTGEKWGFQRTEVLKKFPFPVIENVRFIPESIVWTAIARHYKTRYVNERLRIYWTEESQEERESDQLTRSSIAALAAGRSLYYLTVLNQQMKFFRYAPDRFLRSAALYVRCSLHSRESIRNQFAHLETVSARLLWAVMLPLGFLLYLRDEK